MTRSLTIALCLAFLLAAPPSVAHADHDTRGPEPMDPGMALIAQEKRALSDMFARVMEGTLGRESFEEQLAALLRRIGEDPALASGGLPGNQTILGHDGAAVNLAVAQYAQSFSYYCGPGSGYSLLQYLGNTVSAYDGLSLSQGNLAQTQYFRTNYYGNTPWYTSPSDPNGPHPVPAGLNRWRVGAIQGWYVPVAYPTSVATYKNDLRYDIGHMGYPLMGNTVEFAGGLHYNSHPNVYIEHWIVLDGFANYGDTTWYTDPAANAPSLGWSGVQQYNSVASSTMLSSFLAHRGYVW